MPFHVTVAVLWPGVKSWDTALATARSDPNCKRRLFFFNKTALRDEKNARGQFEQDVALCRRHVEEGRYGVALVEGHLRGMTIRQWLVQLHPDGLRYNFDRETTCWEAHGIELHRSEFEDLLGRLGSPELRAALGHLEQAAFRAGAEKTNVEAAAKAAATLPIPMVYRRLVNTLHYHYTEKKGAAGRAACRSAASRLRRLLTKDWTAWREGDEVERANCHYKLACALRRLGNLDRAALEFEAAQALYEKLEQENDPRAHDLEFGCGEIMDLGAPHIYWLQAQRAEKRGDFQSALALYRKSRHPDFADQEVDLARCLWRMGRKAQARALFRRLDRESFSLNTLWYHLISYAQLGLVDRLEAIRDRLLSALEGDLSHRRGEIFRSMLRNPTAAPLLAATLPDVLKRITSEDGKYHAVRLIKSSLARLRRLAGRPATERLEKAVARYKYPNSNKRLLLFVPHRHQKRFQKLQWKLVALQHESDSRPMPGGLATTVRKSLLPLFEQSGIAYRPLSRDEVLRLSDRDPDLARFADAARDLGLSD